MVSALLFLVARPMIRFVCQSCGKKLKSPDDKAGTKTSCPNCKQVVHVPTASPTLAFTCALCGAALERPEEFAGEIMPCPQCLQLIAVPDRPGQQALVVERGAVFGEVTEPPPAPKLPVPAKKRQVPVIVEPPPYHDATPAMFIPPPVRLPQKQEKETKDCPFCGEEVLAVAKKCKHCGETIDVALRAAEEAKRAAEKSSSQQPLVFMNAGGAAASSSAASSGDSRREREEPSSFMAWHVIHGILTLFTAGLWLPVWAIHFFIWVSHK